MARRDQKSRKKSKGWYATFALLVAIAFIAIYALTGQDAIGTAGRFLWNGFVLARNVLIRSSGSFFKFWREGSGGIGSRDFYRRSRVWDLGTPRASLFATVRYRKRADGMLSCGRSQKRRGPNGMTFRLVLKLVLTIGLLASQIYLHFLLIIFPIAFLVPVVRRVWVRTADMLLGSWYWKTFGATHRAFTSAIKQLPVVRTLVGAVRLLRLRYLSAWRLWKYDPRYRNADTTRDVSFVEPWRLWRRGELDLYLGRPLLAGSRHAQEHLPLATVNASSKVYRGGRRVAAS